MRGMIVERYNGTYWCIVTVIIVPFGVGVVFFKIVASSPPVRAGYLWQVINRAKYYTPCARVKKNTAMVGPATSMAIDSHR